MDLPATLTKRLSRAQLIDVERWWQGLAPANRASFARPVAARFVDAIEEADEETNDLYEYLVNHELKFADERRFHICTAHPIAREAITDRFIPAGFVCPRGEAECPMRKIVDHAGGDVRFTHE